MAPTFTVFGRVIGASGAPVGRALVSVVSSTASLPEVTQVANAAGDFLLTLPAGTHKIEAFSPDSARKVQKSITTPDTTAVELVLPD